MLRSHYLLTEGEEPPRGAHLISPRLGFTHHGIYVGNGKVVHYGSLARGYRRRPVEEVTLQKFANGRGVWMRAHKSGCFDSAQIIQRARSRIGEDQYGLLGNNCEHFCEWCSSGVPVSYQVQRLRQFARTMAGGATALLCVLVSHHWMLLF
jgi:hypothetical protein